MNIKQIEEREKELKKMRKFVVERLENAPDGKLRIKRKNGHVYYYIRHDAHNSNGKYLPRANIRLIRNLAQKEYDEKALSAIDAELSVIKSCRRHWCELPVTPVEMVYDEIPDELKEMVMPLTESDKLFIKRWNESEFEQLKYKEEEKKYATERGDLVRSKSEMVIANLLFKKGIPYRYECALQICGRIVYPDFTVLDVKKRKEIYWDHFGVVDDYDYAVKALRKMRDYSLAGLITENRIIVTAETSDESLDSGKISSMINELVAA
ncbi:MAG: hypothetical protein J6Y21_10835 [Clostridia bacterium]|nr:hypothetical protein [Clostridia bacterium]